jgi:predicted neuraminidase
VYRETGSDRESVGRDSTSFFMRYEVRKQRWVQSAPIRSANGNIQPAAVELEKDHLVAYCRRGGGYGPQTRGFIVRSESKDGGMTWTEGRDSAFPNPNAAVDLIRLKSGNLLLVFNDSMNSRTPLVAAISKDNDKSYPGRKNIASGRGDFAYPIAIQTRDGKIHVVFTSEGRKVINQAIFDEDWVLK